MTIYIKLRREDDYLTSPKNLAAIIYFAFMCVIGWSNSVGTILMMIGSEDSALLRC